MSCERQLTSRPTFVELHALRIHNVQPPFSILLTFARARDRDIDIDELELTLF